MKRGIGQLVTQKLHEKNRNAASNLWWQSVQDPCHTVFDNCSCPCNRSTSGSDLKVCLFSANFPFFVTHQVYLAYFGEICLQLSVV